MPLRVMYNKDILSRFHASVISIVRDEGESGSAVSSIQGMVAALLQVHRPFQLPAQVAAVVGKLCVEGRGSSRALQRYPRLPWNTDKMG